MALGIIGGAISAISSAAKNLFSGAAKQARQERREVKKEAKEAAKQAEVNENAVSVAAENKTAEPEKKGDLKVTFVELGSVNCIPCRMMQPVMEKVEKTYPGQVKVVFHDVWTDKGRAEGYKFGVRVIPTQVFLDKNGKEYFRHEGFFPFEEVDKILKQKGVN